MGSRQPFLWPARRAFCALSSQSRRFFAACQVLTAGQRVLLYLHTSQHVYHLLLRHSLPENLHLATPTPGRNVPCSKGTEDRADELRGRLADCETRGRR